LSGTQFSKKYDKQDQQGKAAFNERTPHISTLNSAGINDPEGPENIILK
jgi:hypothetical protein